MPIQKKKIFLFPGSTNWGKCHDYTPTTGGLSLNQLKENLGEDGIKNSTFSSRQVQNCYSMDGTKQIKVKYFPLMKKYQGLLDAITPLNKLKTINHHQLINYHKKTNHHYLKPIKLYTYNLSISWSLIFFFFPISPYYFLYIYSVAL